MPGIEQTDRFSLPSDPFSMASSIRLHELRLDKLEAGYEKLDAKLDSIRGWAMSIFGAVMAALIGVVATFLKH